MCMPKHLGGLGIKKTKLMNQALLAKIRWRLNQRDPGLWGKLFKEKYLKGGNLTDLASLTPKYCSSTWRGVLSRANLLMDGMKWRVGNGRDIRF